jgi:hypothetical protein
VTRQARKKHQSSEHFTFEVANWSYDYGLHINRAAGLRKYMGLCWETNCVVLRGALRSPTRRRIDRVQLRLDPGGRDPATWKEEWKGFGAATSIRGGVIEAFLSVPTPSFQTLLVAIGLGKVRFVTFNVDFAEDRRVVTDLYTSETPDEEDQAETEPPTAREQPAKTRADAPGRSGNVR